MSTREPKDFYADCGHEIVDGSDFDLRRGEAGGAYFYNGITICPECAETLTAGKTLREIMEAFGAKFLSLEELRNEQFS